jgi:proline racemase
MKIQKSYSTIDVHVAGEAFRIVKDLPLISYRNLEDLYNRFPLAFMEEINLLLNEPRGFAGLNGCLVLPPIQAEADAAVLFFNHQGTLPIHYGGIVAVITALLESGQLKAKSSNHYQLESLNGIISVTAVIELDEVVSVKIESGPCLVLQTGLRVPALHLDFSLVQSDQLYAVFNKKGTSVEIQMDTLSELKRWGKTVFQHLNLELGVKGAIIVDDTDMEDRRTLSLSYQDDGFIVRSPGFGQTAAVYTYLISNEAIEPDDQPFANESIFGSRLQVQAAGRNEGGYQFSFTARGFITGMQTFLLDPTDPLATGFLLK